MFMFFKHSYLIQKKGSHSIISWLKAMWIYSILSVVETVLKCTLNSFFKGKKPLKIPTTSPTIFSIMASK